ncbi:hypothetical protein [Lentzea jiangxiensis]|uniref:Uncharacterized protein n=1 Tax=Lentzea jiangxiensis TaxID=641025 RepID=A0A1H0SQZ8_9PSEU|nr:hypothetical protein [Lentzea jiangxiensis]SDP43626.1 hypothetical protein SAMN05421507_108189 [Lentzea jiangxiensis]
MRVTFLVAAAAVAQLIGVPVAAASDVHRPSIAFDYSAGENPEDLSFNRTGP